jgi:hypothetical protein
MGSVIWINWFRFFCLWQKTIIPFFCGIGLMVIPYFISNLYILILAGIVLAALPFFIKM